MSLTSPAYVSWGARVVSAGLEVRVCGCGQFQINQTGFVAELARLAAFLDCDAEYMADDEGQCHCDATANEQTCNCGKARCTTKNR